MLDHTQDYIEDKVLSPIKLLTNKGIDLISQDDVIMTYKYSYIVKRVLEKAKSQGIRFSVVVVDAAPTFEGREMV